MTRGEQRERERELTGLRAGWLNERTWSWNWKELTQGWSETLQIKIIKSFPYLLENWIKEICFFSLFLFIEPLFVYFRMKSFMFSFLSSSVYCSVLFCFEWKLLHFHVDTACRLMTMLLGFGYRENDYTGNVHSVSVQFKMKWNKVAIHCSCCSWHTQWLPSGIELSPWAWE